MNRSQSFNATHKEILTAYSHDVSISRRIYYEYSSQYRRIVVLEHGSGFEIHVSYKDIAREYNKSYSTFWGEKNDAIGWAKIYSENRNIRCGILTIIEKRGKQLI
jgi:uncharacterized membrane protein